MPFCCFEEFLGIHRELSILAKKVTLSETCTEILKFFFFFTMFEIGKSIGKLGFS